MSEADLHAALGGIRQQIGELMAGMDAVREGNVRREGKMNAIADDLVALRDVPIRLGKVEAVATDFVNLKHKGLGALAMAGVLGAIVSALVVGWVRNWFWGPTP